jgi:hypothetical protein
MCLPCTRPFGGATKGEDGSYQSYLLAVVVLRRWRRHLTPGQHRSCGTAAPQWPACTAIDVAPPPCLAWVEAALIWRRAQHTAVPVTESLLSPEPIPLISPSVTAPNTLICSMCLGFRLRVLLGLFYLGSKIRSSAARPRRSCSGLDFRWVLSISLSWLLLRSLN